MLSRQSGQSFLISQGVGSEQAERVQITSINDLPAHNYPLSGLPSELLTGEIEPVIALANQIVADDSATLAKFAISDRATLEDMIRVRLGLALLENDLPGVTRAAQDLRDVQSREDRRLTVGVIEEAVGEASASADPSSTVYNLLKARLGAVPYLQIDAWLKGERATYALANPDVVIGRTREDTDTIAKRGDGKVSRATAASIVAARADLDRFYPIAPQIAKALGEIIDANSHQTTADIWAERDVVLTEDSPATPISIAVWDGGVDMSLFAPASDPGLAIDAEANDVPELLRKTGQYEEQLPELIAAIKGVMELRAGLMTPDALDAQQKVAALKPEETKDFFESLGFAGFYLHGTHVAGIAVAGNPHARVQAISMHLPYRQEDFRISREISERRAAFYTEAVRRMRAAGVRVVNMSWRFGPDMFDMMFAAQGDYPDAAERKKAAQELFNIEKAALKAAIVSAPEILFVAGAGNEANDSGFSDYIPAGLSADNLLTVGAVDRAGREAQFTSVGGTVAIHANGVDIESLLPGGGLGTFSGTSMASPQVANAGAKLIAMKPELTGAQARALLTETADKQGNVILLNTRAAFIKAGIAV